ncbi:MAG: GTPase/DUF3482 domain-containing protein [Phycisphaerales bacterium]
MTQYASVPPLRVAVVGHTNTGKTSLMRTLLRDEHFGEVEDRPAVTIGVDTAVLSAGGESIVELADTPGLEDSIGLLERIEDARQAGEDGIDAIRRVLGEPDCQPGARFSQEAMSLRQVLESDAVLYVVDARDPVRAKHRDELTILAWCARPVVPVLNFVTGDEARTSAWREQLRRVNMHATASFDTVVYDAAGERRLFEKLRTMVHASAASIDRLIAARAGERHDLVRGAARLMAEMVLDVAAFTVSAPREEQRRLANARAAGHPTESPLLGRFRDAVRDREARSTRAMLELFRFDPRAAAIPELMLHEGRWGLDLFSREALKRWGVRAGGAVAAGAVAGLTLDAAVGGLSGGAGAITGAAIGGVVELSRSHGRRLFGRLRGETELRVDDPTLQLMIARQYELAAVLLRRGHAAVGPIAPPAAPGAPGAAGATGASGAMGGGSPGVAHPASNPIAHPAAHPTAAHAPAQGPAAGSAVGQSNPPANDRFTVDREVWRLIKEARARPEWARGRLSTGPVSGAGPGGPAGSPAPASPGPGMSHVGPVLDPRRDEVVRAIAEPIERAMLALDAGGTA